MKKAIESTYDPYLRLVKTGYEEDEGSITKGVKQGSVLSPLLFIAYMDNMIKKYKEIMGNLGVGGALMCADNIAR